MNRAWTNRIAWLFTWVSPFVLYAPWLVLHAQNSLDPYRFHDDVRALGFFRAYQNMPDGPVGPDYLGDYAWAVMPVGVRAMYSMASFLWDPESLSKALPYVLLLITAIATALTTRRFAGRVGAWAGLMLTLGGSYYMERMTGGLPRAFAFPFVACIVAAVVHGRMRVLAALTGLSSAFYAPAGVMGGIALFGLLFLRPQDERGDTESWTTRKRILLIALSAGLFVLWMVPTVLAMQPYGRRILPVDIASFPEAGPSGTHGPEDRPPYESFLAVIPNLIRRGVFGSGEGWVPPLFSLATQNHAVVVDLVVALVVMGLLGASDASRRRLIVVSVAAIGGYLVAVAFAPYFYAPSRQLHYAVPVLIAVLMVASLVRLFRLGDGATTRRRASFIAAVLLLHCFLGGRGDPSIGLGELSRENRPLYQTIRQLPKETMVAGWPDELMSNVPYFGRRRAYLTGEGFVAYHVGYVTELRRRMRLFIDAYFATSIEPLLRLRDEEKVTHLLLDLDHFRGSSPGYMPPMGEWVRRAVNDARGRTYAVLRQMKTGAMVHRSGRIALLALSKLDATYDAAQEVGARADFGEPEDVTVANAHSGRCLVAIRRPGAVVALGACAPQDPDARFDFKRARDSVGHRLVLRAEGGVQLCVGVSKEHPASGDPVLAMPCDAPGISTLLVDPHPDQSVSLTIVNTEYAIDATPDAGIVQLFGLHDGPNQRWIVRPTSREP